MEPDDDMNICRLAADFLEITSRSSSKEEALRGVADHASEAFSISTGIFPSEDFDRVSFHFMDLIDRVVFEIKENYPSSPAVRDSIFDNLFDRLILFCEALYDINIYRTNLLSRKLYFEDTVIISCFSLSEFNSYLTGSFEEHPDLQKSIVKTLLRTGTSNETQFFYNTASGSFCYELRILGLMGLKLKSENNIQWNCIKAENPLFKQAVEHIRTLDTNLLFDEPHENIFITLFALYYAEVTCSLFSTEKKLLKLLSYLKHSINSDRNNSSYADIPSTVSDIILFLTDSQFEMIIENTPLMKLLIEILDNLPQDNSVYISRRLGRFRTGIASSINGLFQSGSLNFSDTASNAIRYISLDI